METIPDVPEEVGGDISNEEIQRTTSANSPPPALTLAPEIRVPPIPHDEEPVPGLRRFPTMPTESQERVSSVSPAPTNRTRGRSLSSQEQAQLAHLPSHTRSSKDEGSKMRPIPESRPVSPTLDQGDAASFISPGLRKRATTWRTIGGGGGGNIGRGRSMRRRPTLNTGVASGIAQDEVNFSLAGPSPVVAEVAANQPYVDPGYSQLNPAYDQPDNVRPVWGLAKPLPRVLRPGMVPTRSEYQIETLSSSNNQQEPDLEQGVDQTLNLGRISSQLQETRRKRENSLIQNIGSSSGQGAGLGRQFSTRSQGVGRQTSTRSRLTGTTPFPSLEEDQNELLEKPPTHQAGDAENAAQDAQVEGDWTGDDDFSIKDYEQHDEEVHNLHTHWSVIRLQFREPLAELLAVRHSLSPSSRLYQRLIRSPGNRPTHPWILC